MRWSQWLLSILEKPSTFEKGCLEIGGVQMEYTGSCDCNRWRVNVQLEGQLEELKPRVCDCNYCQTNPSQILSDPNMSANFTGEGSYSKQIGDQLAHFYHCSGCDVLLAVGCTFDGELRGAVNGNLLKDKNRLREPIQIQPRLLSADEKLERWGKLWGTLKGL